MFYNIVNSINRAVKQKQSSFFVKNTKVNIKILNILWDNQLISSFKIKNTSILVNLKFSNWGVFLIKEIKLISKPGRRVFFKSKNINREKNKIYFFSSNKGLTTDINSKGGELLFLVYF